MDCKKNNSRKNSFCRRVGFGKAVCGGHSWSLGEPTICASIWFLRPPSSSSYLNNSIFMLEFKSKTQTLEKKIWQWTVYCLNVMIFCNVCIKLILNCTLFAEKGCDESSVNAISFGHAEKKLHGAVFVFRWELSIKETSLSSQIFHWKYFWVWLRRQSKKRTLLGVKRAEFLRAPFPWS